MSGSKCQNCGAMVPAGSARCPACGELFEGFGFYESRDMYSDRRGYGMRPDTLGPFPKAIMIYGVLALLFGIILFVSSANADGNWANIADSDGKYYGLTLDEFKSMCSLLAGMFIASGACAAVSGFLAGKRIMFVPSFALCTLSSLLALSICIADRGLIVLGIILLLIGVFMSNRIRINRDSFMS